MKPTLPTGSPARTGTRSSLVRDPGAKNFQEFGKDIRLHLRGKSGQQDTGQAGPVKGSHMTKPDASIKIEYF